jgi:hypothetical protein
MACTAMPMTAVISMYDISQDIEKAFRGKGK